MKKKFKLTNLDCANCAAKMENAIKKIDGVRDANVSFMTQKMTIEADDSRFAVCMQKSRAGLYNSDVEPLRMMHQEE